MFVASRLSSLAVRLACIRGGGARQLLTAAWHVYYGTGIHGVNWDLLTLEELGDVVEGIGGAALAALLGLMAEDYSGWSGGAPDLLLWRRRTGAVAGAGGSAGGGGAGAGGCQAGPDTSPLFMST